jgi:hypothetical protein
MTEFLRKTELQVVKKRARGRYPSSFRALASELRPSRHREPMDNTIFEVLLSKRDTGEGLALHIHYDNKKNRYSIAEEEGSTEGEEEGLSEQHEYGTLSEALEATAARLQRRERVGWRVDGRGW